MINMIRRTIKEERHRLQEAWLPYSAAPSKTTHLKVSPAATNVGEESDPDPGGPDRGQATAPANREHQEPQSLMVA